MNESASRYRLCSRLANTIEKFPENIAVQEKHRSLTYRQFDELISTIQESLCQHTQYEPISDQNPIGILLPRGADAYAAMFAAISLGRTYVPLNAKFPPARLKQIADGSNIETIICDRHTRPIACKTFADNPPVLVETNTTELSGGFGSRHQCCGTHWSNTAQSNKAAYILFTSGSTGKPKGVPISCSNLLSFLDHYSTAVRFTPSDHCSQLSELSFDLSIQEILPALMNGSTLYPALDIDLFNPAHYITTHSISILTCVPSLVRLILSHQVSEESTFDSIRLSIFNGEALNESLAKRWSNCIPKAVICNSYGPTECTVAVSLHRWTQDKEESMLGSISLGRLFPDFQAALLDESGKFQPLPDMTNDSAGELLLCSRQRFNGYLQDTDSSPFYSSPSGVHYYRTGDKVLLRNGLLYFTGRLDHQVKINGYRVDLLEIEHHLSEYFGTSSVAAVVRQTPQGCELVAVVDTKTAAIALNGGALGLPSYMVPKHIMRVDMLPLNNHGKLDRQALAEIVRMTDSPASET